MIHFSLLVPRLQALKKSARRASNIQEDAYKGTRPRLQGILADDFSLYLHRPTATDKSFAPDGCDSFYVLCPVPNLLGDVDWKTEGPALRDRIVAALDRTIMPGLGDVITDDFWMTPEDSGVLFKRTSW